MVIEDPTLLHEEPDRISKNDAFWQPVTWAEQEKLKYPFTFVPLKDLMSHEEEKPALTQGISDKAKSLPDQPIETEQSRIKSGGEVGDTTQLLTATLPLDLPISSEEQIEVRRYLAEYMSRLPVSAVWRLLKSTELADEIAGSAYMVAKPSGVHLSIETSCSKLGGNHSWEEKVEYGCEGEFVHILQCGNCHRHPSYRPRRRRSSRPRS